MKPSTMQAMAATLTYDELITLEQVVQIELKKRERNRPVRIIRT